MTYLKLPYRVMDLEGTELPGRVSAGGPGVA
jgi:hypothetical protein